MAEWVLVAAFVFVALSFLLSASAGMGGSLILVPAMAALLGTKEGVTIAALLLACNNIFKLIAYYKWIPFKQATTIIALTMLGAALGANFVSAIRVHRSLARVRHSQCAAGREISSLFIPVWSNHEPTNVAR